MSTRHGGRNTSPIFSYRMKRRRLMILWRTRSLWWKSPLQINGLTSVDLVYLYSFTIMNSIWIITIMRSWSVISKQSNPRRIHIQKNIMIWWSVITRLSTTRRWLIQRKKVVGHLHTKYNEKVKNHDKVVDKLNTKHSQTKMNTTEHHDMAVSKLKTNHSK